MRAQLPAVERVDGALVAIEDQLDLLAAAGGLAARARAGRAARIQPLAREPGAHRRRLMAGERAGARAETAADAGGVDAAAARAYVRGDERALGVRIGADRGSEIARRADADVQVPAQVGELVLVFEQPGFAGPAARLLRALHGTLRRDGLRDRPRLLL